MMHIGMGNRDKWVFDYKAKDVAAGAKSQKAFRESRVKWWTEQKEQLMAQVKDSGLEIVEGVADKAGYLTGHSHGIGNQGPQIKVRDDLQGKLQECHSKIQAHTKAAAEYEGWIQVLESNPEQTMSLTQADWLYFFGKL